MISGFNFESLSSLAGQVLGFISKPDPKGYASAVKDLHDPEVMRRILEDRIKAIENDEKLSRDEKEALKSKVVAQYLEEDIKHVQACADVTDRDADNRAKLFNVIFGGVLASVAVLGAAKGAAYYCQHHIGQLQIVPKSTR